jgi:lycopene beta-cyclase
MLRAIDFYDFVKNEIQAKPNFHWVKDEVKDISRNAPPDIAGAKDSYRAEYVFDSRIDPAFFQKNDGHTRLLQHFKGWVIRTPDSVFDPNQFTMMDFRLKWKDSTSFTYVLPLSEREALVEFTLFTDHLIENNDYDRMLQLYIETYLPLKQYEITEVEKGVIPMSDFPFQKNNSKHLVKIGTAGGWVKPSSGYAFKNCEKFSHRIASNLKAGKSPADGLFSARFRWYDSLFLDVLNRRNELGETLFSTMYTQNDIQRIFRFLDEETTFPEELRLISKFPQLPFLHALFKKLVR